MPQIKITLDPKIADELDKEAKTMGLKLHDYIKMLLGQHIAKKETKSMKQNLTDKVEVVIPRRFSRKAEYRKAIEWIAGNDEPGVMDWIEIVDLISVVMVADLFKVSANEVAKDVIEIRVYGGEV